MRAIAGLSEFRELVGQELGVGSWITVTQEMIAEFADITSDHQWIHVDTDRAQSGPFGTTVAHGYLTLSLLPALTREVFVIDGLSMAINYGLNRVRFPSPVRSGSRIRNRASLVSLEPAKKGMQAVILNQIDIEGSDAPACVAESVSLLVP